MMKTSFGRLRRFASPKADAIDMGELFPTAQIEGLSRAAKEASWLQRCRSTTSEYGFISRSAFVG